MLHDTIAKERHVFSEQALVLERKRKATAETHNVVAEEEWLNVCQDRKLLPISGVEVIAGDFDCRKDANKSWKKVWQWFREFISRKDANKSWKKKAIDLESFYIWNSGVNIKRRKGKLSRVESRLTRVRLPYEKFNYTDNVKRLTGKYVVTEHIYGLTGVEIKPDKNGNPTVTLKICGGKYSDFYDTCDFMTYEIAHRMYIEKHAYEKITIDDLPYRKRIDPFDLSNRFSGIGICTLTILKNFEDDSSITRFLVHHRSPNMAEGGEVFHAVPAGSYEPVCTREYHNFDKIDKSPTNTIIREFLEEVIDSESYNRLASEELLEEGRKKLCADIFFVGIGFEPLNLKTEMLTCMIIDVKNSQLFHERTSKDFNKNFTKSYEGEVKIREFTKGNLEHYENNLRSIPAFREILRVVIEHRDEIEEHTVCNNLNNHNEK